MYYFNLKGLLKRQQKVILADRMKSKTEILKLNSKAEEMAPAYEREYTSHSIVLDDIILINRDVTICMDQI